MVLFTDPKMINELAYADPKILSFRHAGFEVYHPRLFN